MKSHQELKITEGELDALIQVRDKLANGCFVHATTRDPRRGEFGFSMSEAGENTSCGTVACIGGWMNLVMSGAKPKKNGVFRDKDVEASSEYVLERSGSLEPIHDLFYPPPDANWDNITTEMAVEAIDNFLKYGKPHWERVIPQSPAR